MKSSMLRVTAAATLVALSLTGCTTLGTLGLVTAGVAAVVGIVVVAKIIAKNKATAQQRRLAEERAKLFYADLDAKKKEELRKKNTLIAVDTKKETAGEGHKEVMLWNPAYEEIVGNTVYTVKEPKVGPASFDGYKAEYIGSGPAY
jgi:hypothetical protein